MNITADVINDLLPAYLSGEASPDTCAVVEDYFRQNPDFERQARHAMRALRGLGQADVAALDQQVEKTTLQRAKSLLRRQKILLALASTFTLNVLTLGFSFEIGGGHIRMHWLTLPGQREVVVVILLLAIVSWIFYFRVSRRVRTRVLG